MKVSQRGVFGLHECVPGDSFPGRFVNVNFRHDPLLDLQPVTRGALDS